MIIDEQFRTLIPPLTDDEFSRLEESILKDGIRDKLVVWNDTLIDGHNRYRIATEHGLTYETVQKDFESREHALNWIISNQLGRRNLNPNQIAYLRGKRFESEKKIIGGDKKSAEYKKSIAQNGPLNGDTAQRIADEYGIGRNTVKRAEKFAKVVDLLPEEARKNILGGNESIKQKESEAILKFDKPTQKKFLKEVESGTPIKEAVKKVDPEQKRKENDERIRREMERERELREKTKFSTHVRKFHDITTGTKQLILDNMHLIPENAEIWVIYKKETAEEARSVLNTNTDLNIN